MDLWRLVAAGRLTKFQAGMLASGQGQFLTLGNYVLVDQLGEGGMGAVYKARHSRLGRLVAVKIIRKDLLSPTAAKRFVREVRAAAKLDHPLIVRALDADEIGGQHFLAMEYVEGEDLAREVQARGPFPITEAAEVTFQVTLALQHLHEAGIVHRDLKPTNLIRDHKTGAVKILDLGLARILRRDGETDFQSGSLTQVGSVFGTPDFMAPEQGQAAKLADGRSDLYSLGCVLYFLLTADVPFPGGTAIEKIIRHNTEAPRPVSDFRTDTPPGLLVVLNRLMAKNPSLRYQTPAELVAALTTLGFTSSAAIPVANSTAVVSHAVNAPTAITAMVNPPLLSESVRENSEPSSVATRGSGRRGEYRLILAASLGIVLAVGLLVAVVIPWTPSHQPIDPTDDQSFRGRVARWMKNGTASEGATLRAEAFAVMRSGGDPAAREALELLRYLPSPLDEVCPPGRDGEPFIIGQTGRRHYGPVHHLAVSQDGKTVVTGGGDRAIRIWDAETLNLKRTLIKHVDPVLRVAVSADGTRFAGASGFQTDHGALGFERALRVFGEAEQATCEFHNMQGGWTLSAAFTPDGKHVLAGQYDCSCLCPIEKPVAVRRVGENTNWNAAVAVSPDGRFAFTGGVDPNWHRHDRLLVWDLFASPPAREENQPLAPEQPTHRLGGHLGSILSIAPHPNPADRRVASACSEQTVRVFDYTSGKLLRAFDVRKELGGPRAVSWSPGGAELVVATESGALVWHDAATGAELRAGVGHIGEATGVGANGSHVFSCGHDGTVRKWNPKTGVEVSPTRAAFAAVRMAFVDEDRQLVVLPERGPPVTVPVNAHKLPVASLGGNALALSRDGGFALTQTSPTVATVTSTATGKSVAFDRWGDMRKVTSAAISPGGTHVAIVGESMMEASAVRYIELTTGAVRRFPVSLDPGGAPSPTPQTPSLTALAFSPDSKHLVAVNQSRDVMGWSVDDGQVVFRATSAESVESKPGYVRQLVVASKPLRVFAIGIANDLWILTPEKPHTFAPIPIRDPRAIAISADEKLIAIGGGEGGVAVMTTAGVLRQTVRTPGRVTSLAFSIDGHVVAVGQGDGSVWLCRLDR